MMKNTKLLTTFSEYTASKILESSDSDTNINTDILDRLVKLVGNETDIEESAREAFEDLKLAFEKNNIKSEEGKNAESLVFSALIVKLVENGKLSPTDADSILGDLL